MKRFLIMISVLTFCLTFLLVTPAMAFEPIVTTSRSDPDSVDVGEEESWDITIGICGDDDEDLEDVVVQGGIGADLDEISITTFPTIGTVSLEKKGKGKMGATMITWDIGTLAKVDCLTLVLTVTTGLNPKGYHEFTEADEDHALDGGFSATYTYGDIEYETDETTLLTVDVVE